MKWTVYEILPIDFGWENLKSVKATFHALAEGHDEFEHPDGINTDEVRGFLTAWESAKQAAKQHGWEGDFRNDPSVFWLPAEHSFEFGFVIKQDNNGTTFVVSPRPLPWLRS